jgi:hypothetical protein
MSEPQTTIAVDWQIATTGVTVIGNSANAYDAPTQSTTFGPYPPTADAGAPETNGEPGLPPTGA